MEALTLHEAVPGHNLPLALAQELEDVHNLRSPNQKANGFSSRVRGDG